MWDLGSKLARVKAPTRPIPAASCDRRLPPSWLGRGVCDRQPHKAGRLQQPKRAAARDCNHQRHLLTMHRCQLDGSFTPLVSYGVSAGVERRARKASGILSGVSRILRILRSIPVWSGPAQADGAVNTSSKSDHTSDYLLRARHQFIPC